MPETYRHIAVASTFSPRFLAVLAEADRMARLLTAKMSIIHADEAEDGRLERFAEAMRTLERLEETPVLWGRAETPADAILAACREHGVDLLLAGALERESEHRNFVGGVARELLQRCDCDLLLFPRPEELERPLETVLVQVDLKNLSIKALNRACRLAARLRAERVTFFTVITPFDEAMASSGSVRLPSNEDEFAELLDDVDGFDGEADTAIIRSNTGFAACDYVEKLGSELARGAVAERRRSARVAVAHGLAASGDPDECLDDGQMKIIALALLGAVFAGLGALYFEWVEELSEVAGAWVWEASRWWMFVVMPLGLGLILFLRDRYFVGSDGTGIPQTIAALQLGPGEERDRLMSIRIAAGKVLLTTLGLFSFLSIGREGPSVQVGACLMNLVSRWGNFPAHLAQRGMMLAGGAAGIAAAFNAPVAGIVFSFEEIGRSFEKENLGTLVRTVVVACVVCAVPFGDYFFYGRIDFGRTVPLEFLAFGPWLAVVLVGVVGGLLGGSFSWLLLRCMPTVSGWIRRRFWVVALAFGLAMAGLAMLSDGRTLGSGYAEARAVVVQGSEDYLSTLSTAERAELDETREAIGPLYPVYRASASMLALLTGIPGGLFDPSFSVGAGLGKWCAPWLEWTGAPAQAVVLLFIVSYFSGVVQSPLTAAVILVEMTGAVAFTLPLALAAILAYEASRRVCSVPLYEALAENFMRKVA